MLRLLFLLLVNLFCTSLQAKPTIAWFTNLPEEVETEGGFWRFAYYFAVAAAEDLDVDLQIYFSDTNHILMKRQVDQVLRGASKPDGVIMHNYKGIGRYALEVAEQEKIYTLIFNAGFDPRSVVGEPRRRLKYWLGQLLPDDRYAGQILAEKLIEEHTKLAGKEILGLMVGLQGNHTSEASNLRMEGLMQVLEADKSVKLAQFLPLDWKRYKAAEALPALLGRYPDIKIIWGANDSMALGILDALGQRAGPPLAGEDLVIGGIDWLPEALEKVKSGEIAVSVGGHFYEGALAVVLMHDFFKGYDFTDLHPTTIKTRMTAVTSSNIREFGNLSEKLTLNRIRQIDFTALSRAFHPDMKSYNLSIETLLTNR